jgi:hypothetical protein
MNALLLWGKHPTLDPRSRASGEKAKNGLHALSHRGRARSRLLETPEMGRVGQTTPNSGAIFRADQPLAAKLAMECRRLTSSWFITHPRGSRPRCAIPLSQRPVLTAGQHQNASFGNSGWRGYIFEGAGGR